MSGWSLVAAWLLLLLAAIADHTNRPTDVAIYVAAAMIVFGLSHKRKTP